MYLPLRLATKSPAAASPYQFQGRSSPLNHQTSSQQQRMASDYVYVTVVRPNNNDIPIRFWCRHRSFGIWWRQRWLCDSSRAKISLCVPVTSGVPSPPFCHLHQEFLGFIPIKNSWDLFPSRIPGIYSLYKCKGNSWDLFADSVRHFPTQKFPCVCQ